MKNCGGKLCKVTKKTGRGGADPAGPGADGKTNCTKKWKLPEMQVRQNPKQENQKIDQAPARAPITSGEKDYNIDDAGKKERRH